MIALFKRLREDRRGNILVLAGACMPLLVGAAGLATDTIQWALWKRQLQRAADSAAIAGVYTRVKTDTETAVNASVATDLQLNNHTGIALNTGFPKVELLANDGDAQRRVRVTLELSKSLPFSSIFLKNAPRVSVVATAASVPGAAEYCVVALDPSASAVGIDIAGSTDIDMGDCSLIANSKHPSTAATNTGVGSTVIARSIAAAGGVSYSSKWTVDSYDPYSSPVADPFAKVPIPAKTACTRTVNVNKADFPIDWSGTDSAGQVVCITGDLTVQGTMKLGNATYVIDGGDLTMNSTGSSLSCGSCTVIMTNYTDPTKTGNIKITGGNLALTAPSSGTYQGLVLMQDARGTDTGKKTQNQINGNNGASLTGAIYIPNRSLLYNGGAGTTAPCLQIVSKRVEFSGSSKFKVSNECAAAGLSPIGGGDNARRVRLVA